MTINLEDHKEHDPSMCDYARLLLTQQFVAGTHVEHVAKLSNEQLATVGFVSGVFSTVPEVAEMLEPFNLTLKNLEDFSEYLRNYLLVDRGLGAMLGLPQGDPRLN